MLLVAKQAEPKPPFPWLLLAMVLPAFFLKAPALRAQIPPQWACIRITSHGCSGTCIAAAPGESLILTSAHEFLAPGTERIDPRALARRFTFDAPSPSPGPPRRPWSALRRVDYRADLALIAVGEQLPYVVPVAPSGFFSQQCLSAGYDAMQWPAVVRPATIIQRNDREYATRQRPRPGRSGGGLYDARTGVLVGVCSGFTGPPNGQEVVPNGFGVYIALPAILRFLQVAGPAEVRRPALAGDGPPVVSDSTGVPVPVWSP